MIRGALTSTRNVVSFAFKPLRSAIVAIFAVSMIVNAAFVAVPIYRIQAIRVPSQGLSLNFLIQMTVAAAIMLLLYGTFLGVRSYLLTRVATTFDDRVSPHLLPAIFAAGHTSGRKDSVQGLADLDSVRNFLTSQDMLSLIDSFWVPIFLGTLFVMHPVFGLIGTVAATIIFVLGALNHYLTRDKLSESHQARERGNRFVNETGRNAEAVLGMGMLPDVFRRWHSTHSVKMGRHAQARDISGTVTAANKTIQQLVRVAILGSGAYFTISGSSEIGAPIAALILASRATAPLSSAVANWNNFLNTRASMDRIRWLLREHRDGRQATALPTPAGGLSVEQAVIQPTGASRPVVHGVSFDVAAGETAAIVGPSGAGKTTLARALLGVVRPMAGNVRLDGADLHGRPSGELGDFIGYVPQDVELFDATIAENIARLGSIDRGSVVRAAKLAGLHSYILKFPEAYDTQLRKSGTNLPGGRRQQLAIARAIYGDVRYVVMDEPTASLDADGKRTVKHLLRRLRRRRITTVVITHDETLLEHVDKVIAIQDGRIASMRRPTKDPTQNVGG